MLTIQIVPISKDDLGPAIRLAADGLNGVQRQQDFRYELAGDDLQAKAALAWRNTYQSAELFDWMRANRSGWAKDVPFLIAIIDGPLNSEKWRNIFGEHEAGDRLAVFTINGSGRFVRDVVRFIRYYLIRYSLSFIDPRLLSHDSIDCYFDFKRRKKDILLSMTSGNICDGCRAHLAQFWTPRAKAAIEDMTMFVAGEYPHALVMKGGGVKGLAFAGALLELEQYYSFDEFAGTSAGAIAALLLSAGYSPADLEKELRALNFKEFMDSGWIGGTWNLIVHRGFHAGNRLSRWVAERLQTRLNRHTDVLMRELPSRAVVYASSAAEGLVTFDSKGERRDESAAFAARCSAAIPYFFTPQRIGGHRVYDGGLRENFPFKRFVEKNPGKPTIGLFLKGSDPDRFFVLSELIGMETAGSEIEALRENRPSMVVIDPSPVGAVDFSLTDLEKKLLLAAGRSAAAQFLTGQKLNDGPDQAYVSNLEAATAGLRAKVKADRKRWFRSWRKPLPDVQSI